MRKRGKRRGHFCWCCARTLPNERFSGGGHARHLCRECAKLPAEELAYRQAASDIDRMLDWNGRVRRKQRKSFQRMLAHPNERVRRYAEEIVARAEAERAAARRAHEADERAWIEIEALPWLAGFDVEEDSSAGAWLDVYGEP